MSPMDEQWREDIRRWLQTPQVRVHLMGIGGIGMAGLARLLAAKGQVVSGCDAGSPRTLNWLRAQGIAAVTGHNPAHVQDVDWAIFSPALQPGHPERAAAEKRGIPLYRRAGAAGLAELWRTTIAVAGTHGKTTTSAMITHILRECGVDVSWCIGGELPPTGAPGGVGSADELVIEADESDGTLAYYRPAIAVITNIEFDHMEHFASPEDFLATFQVFAQQARTVIYSADDASTARVGRRLRAFLDSRRSGFSGRRCGDDARRRALHRAGDSRGAAIDGQHNVVNALGALAAATRGGIDLAAATATLQTFALPKRRFECAGDVRGIRVVADYAHHPTEIRALLAAAKQAGADRIWAVFQPHRYTRTLALGADFPPAFDQADGVILTPVYSASEPPLAGGTAEDLCKHFWRHGGAPVELAKNFADAAAFVSAHAQPGDWVLIIGAGDIEQLAPLLLQKLADSA